LHNLSKFSICDFFANIIDFWTIVFEIWILLYQIQFDTKFVTVKIQISFSTLDLWNFRFKNETSWSIAAKLEQLEITVQRQNDQIQRLSNGRMAQPAPPPAIRDSINLATNDYFFGRSDDNFELWIDRFNRLSQANGWDDKKKRLLIPTYFRRFAEVAYNTIPLADRTALDYKHLVDNMRERFVPTGHKEVKAMQLHTRRQRPQESVLNFAL